MQQIIPYLKTASAMSGYKLAVEFEDGLKGEVDLSGWVGKGVFNQWRNENNFKRFKITKNKKIEWSDEIDMDPDSFYLELMGKKNNEHAGH